MKPILFLLSLFAFLSLTAQNQNDFKSIRPKPQKKDSISFTASDYKIISLVKDTTAIDTTLTIRKDYSHNPTGKDLFEFMPLANMGQTYNSLAYSFKRNDLRPKMGLTANDFYYIKSEEIPYYYLPTPITQFMYKTGMEQGQVLQTLFSANVSPNLNLFIRYNALRSLGNYENILSSIGNFIGGFSYNSPNKKYWIFGHFSSQNIHHKENGGLLLREQFESGDKQFSNRGLVDVLMNDAENKWESERYFISHQYHFLREEKHINQQILLKHQFEYEKQNNDFTQQNANIFFGKSYVPSQISDKVFFKTLTNKLGAELVLPYLGKTFVYGKSYFYNYFFRSILFDQQGNKVPNKISNTDYGLGLVWNKNYKGFSVNAQGEQMILGTLLGTRLSGEMSYNFNKKNKILAGVQVISAMPSFNKLLYRSQYKNYNWYNLNEFSRENFQTIYAQLDTQWGKASLDISNIKNYTFFKEIPQEDSPYLAKSSQFTGNIQYLKLKIHKDFQFGKFGVDNDLIYQQVIQSQSILNVPNFITRNTLYFSSFLFEKAMYLQTGVSFKYFTKYYANSYNPLLSEFQVQENQQVGGYPMFDFFINAKVRTMRIFFKVEHFNAGLTGFNYYVTPLQPYHDLSVRFGIQWNFFN